MKKSLVLSLVAVGVCGALGDAAAVVSYPWISGTPWPVEARADFVSLGANSVCLTSSVPVEALRQWNTLVRGPGIPAGQYYVYATTQAPAGPTALGAFQEQSVSYNYSSGTVYSGSPTRTWAGTLPNGFLNAVMVPTNGLLRAKVLMMKRYDQNARVCLNQFSVP